MTVTGTFVSERTTGTMSRFAGARVEQHGALRADDQITVVELVVAGLADRKGRRVEGFDDEIVAEPGAPHGLLRPRSHQRVGLAKPDLGVEVGRQRRRQHREHRR